MIGVKDQNDKRDSWHHGGWLVKFIIWLLLIVLMFFMPNVIIDIYGMLFKVLKFLINSFVCILYNLNTFYYHHDLRLSAMLLSSGEV